MLPATRAPRFTVLDPFQTVRQEMDRLFSRFFGDTGEDGSYTSGWYAPLALWDDNEHVYVEVELPGVARDDLEVTVHQGVLRISGQRRMPEEQRQYWRNERAYGRFERLIALPEVVNADSVDAELRDGILHITLDKRPEAQPRKITVRTS